MRRTKSQPSKNIFVAAAIIAIVAGGSYLFVNKKNEVRPESGDVVVAEINGKPVYSSEADRQLSVMVKGAEGADFSKLDDDSKEIVVREIAAQKIILEEALKGGIDKKKNVKERVEAFKENIIKEEFLASMAKNMVTEEKIRARYDSDSEKLKGKTQYKAKHIVVDSEKEAKSVKNLLKTKSFEAVAKDKSMDDKTALTGGDLGYLVSGSMIPEFEKAISSLKDGEVSDPVKTKFGWHIIKLEDTKPAEPAPYDQVKQLLARALFQEAITDYVKGALDSAKIDIVASKQESVPDAAPASAPASAIQEDKPAPELENSGAAADNG